MCSSAALEDGLDIKKHLLRGLGGIHSSVDALLLVVFHKWLGLGVVGQETFPQGVLVIV